MSPELVRDPAPSTTDLAFRARLSQSSPKVRGPIPQLPLCGGSIVSGARVELEVIYPNYVTEGAPAKA